MIILILCYIFSSTLNWGATVPDIVIWFSNHPFLSILFIEEVLGSIISIKIFKE